MAGRKSHKYDHLSIKIGFYIASLCMFFFIVFLLNLDIKDFFSKNNIIPAASFGCMLVSLGCVWRIRVKVQSSTDVTIHPADIESLNNENFEHLSFLTTYIIPFALLEMDKNRYVVITIILLIMIGWIFIRSGLYYGNPTLAILGYHLYRLTYKKENKSREVLLIAQDHLTDEAIIEAVKLDDNIWFAAKQIDGGNNNGS